MNRVTEYIRFAVGFVGLGYIVLWPLTTHDNGIATPETLFVCGTSFADLICHPAPALQLSPGLHLIGVMSAIYVVLRLLLHQFRRWRRALSDERSASAPPARMNDVLARPPVRPTAKEPAPPLPTVKPRAHFGLRGLPH